MKPCVVHQKRKKENVKPQSYKVKHTRVPGFEKLPNHRGQIEVLPICFAKRAKGLIRPSRPVTVGRGRVLNARRRGRQGRAGGRIKYGPAGLAGRHLMWRVEKEEGSRGGWAGLPSRHALCGGRQQTAHSHHYAPKAPTIIVTISTITIHLTYFATPLSLLYRTFILPH